MTAALHELDPLAAPVVVGRGEVTIADVVRVATDGVCAVLDPEARERMISSRSVIERVLVRGDSVYSVSRSNRLRSSCSPATWST